MSWKRRELSFWRLPSRKKWYQESSISYSVWIYRNDIAMGNIDGYSANEAAHGDVWKRCLQRRCHSVSEGDLSCFWWESRAVCGGGRKWGRGFKELWLWSYIQPVCRHSFLPFHLRLLFFFILSVIGLGEAGGQLSGCIVQRNRSCIHNDGRQKASDILYGRRYTDVSVGTADGSTADLSGKIFWSGSCQWENGGGWKAWQHNWG